MRKQGLIPNKSLQGDFSVRIAKLVTKIFFSETSYEDCGLIEISGVFEGTINKGGKVIITPSGCFYGRMEARNVEIAGLVDGDVQAESLVIYSSGQLYYGELNCQHVSIKDGGTMVNKGEKENKKANEAADKGYPLNTPKSDYTPEGTVENFIKSNLSNQLPNSDEANGQFNQDDIHLVNNPLPDYQETKPLQDGTFSQQAKEQKPHYGHKQPHFYSSY